MKKLTTTFAGLFLAALVFTSCSSDESSVSPVSNTGATLDSKGSGGAGTPGPDGVGGSMARFTISGNNLYTVDHNSLTHYEISDANDPKPGNRIPLSFNVETIFPYQDKLFIGTQSGMHVMGIQNPASPNLISTFTHIVSCDPVVADSRYAYVTLSTGTTCRGGSINELQIIDLQNLNSPRLVRQYPMENPKGLGIDNKNLFICDNGLKLYDATNVNNLVLRQKFNINAFDVIPNNGNLLVIGNDGFYQYTYTNNALEFLSKIPVQPVM